MKQTNNTPGKKNLNQQLNAINYCLAHDRIRRRSLPFDSHAIPYELRNAEMLIAPLFKFRFRKCDWKWLASDPFDMMVDCVMVRAKQFKQMKILCRIYFKNKPYVPKNSYCVLINAVASRKSLLLQKKKKWNRERVRESENANK